MCSIACWAPPFPLMPKQASLLGSGVSLDSPLECHSLRDLASITPGLARSFLFFFSSKQMICDPLPQHYAEDTQKAKKPCPNSSMDCCIMLTLMTKEAFSDILLENNSKPPQQHEPCSTSYAVDVPNYEGLAVVPNVLFNEKHVRAHAAKHAFWNISQDLTGNSWFYRQARDFAMPSSIGHQYCQAATFGSFHDGLFSGCNSLIVSLDV